MAFIAHLAQDTAAAKNVKPRTPWMDHWKNKNSLSCLTCSCADSIYGSEVIATEGHSSSCVCPKDQHKKTFLVIYETEWGQGEFKDSYLINNCLTDVTQLPIIEYQMDGPRMHENASELMTLTEDLPFQWIKTSSPPIAMLHTTYFEVVSSSFF